MGTCVVCAKLEKELTSDEYPTPACGKIKSGPGRLCPLKSWYVLLVRFLIDAIFYLPHLNDICKLKFGPCMDS